MPEDGPRLEDADPSAAEQRSIRELFEHRLSNEPPLILDWPTLHRRLQRRVRARRSLAIGGIVLAVAALSAGAAVWSTQTAGDDPTSTSVRSVPGCDKVIATDDPAVSVWQSHDDASAMLTISSAPSSQAASNAPPDWYTTDMAAAWSSALRAALPPGVQMTLGSDGLPLPFDHSFGPGGDGNLTAGSVTAHFDVSIGPWNGGTPPPCTADLILRVNDFTGTVTIVAAASPVEWRADSYRADGTLVTMDLNGGSGSNAMPLSVTQFATLAATAGLTVHAG